jgi:hypothetical protein
MVDEASVRLQLERSTTELSADKIHSIHLMNGNVVSASHVSLPPTAYSPVRGALVAKPLSAAPATRRKLDKMLEDKVKRAEETNKAAEKVHVLVTFVEDRKIPRLPRLVDKEPRDSATNRGVVQRIHEMVTDIENARAPVQNRVKEELAARHSAQTTDTLWLINGLAAELPMNQVRALADRADVAYVEAVQKEIPPPNPLWARSFIGTDAYYDWGLWFGYIALLDTGVRSTHQLFNSPGHPWYLRDCVNGTSNYCATGSGLDPSDVSTPGHGTSSMSILNGNSNSGNTYRGVTDITVDSYRVYTALGLNTLAAVRGFQAALGEGDGLIVAEMQDYTDQDGAVSTAADAAFDAGVPVVAAAGNYGELFGMPVAGSVRSPADAHKVLGVGALDNDGHGGLALYPASGRGPAEDGRTKPDILAPTGTTVAANCSDWCFQSFYGTSGATPYAAGAVAFLRNWVIQNTWDSSPGIEYALAIMSGNNTSSPTTNQDRGAGLIVMPPYWNVQWGSVTVDPWTQADVPIYLESPGLMDVAIWWPESVSQTHNDVDLALVDPYSGEAASTATASVFEKIEYDGVGTTGTWTVSIRPSSVSSSQTVYWALAVRN